MNQLALIPLSASEAAPKARKASSAPAKRYAAIMEEAAAYVAECKPLVTSPEHVAHLMRPLMLGQKQERMYCLCVNTQNCVVSIDQLTVGLTDRCLLNAPVVFRHVLLSGCVKFILCHNHPSGNATPSRADLDTTKQLILGTTLLELTLLDHIILGEVGNERCPAGHHSMLNYGQLR